MIGVSLGLRSLVIEPGAATVETPPGPAVVATEPAAESAGAPAGRVAAWASASLRSDPQEIVKGSAARGSSALSVRRLCIVSKGSLERQQTREAGSGKREAEHSPVCPRYSASRRMASLLYAV